MSLWSTLRTAVQTVAPAAKPKPRAPSRDPWFSDLPRRAAVNARREGRHSWLGDTSTWWQRGRRRELDS